MSFEKGDHRLFISGDAGNIESWLTVVENPVGIAICCHPHSQHGGSMTNKVVRTLHKSFHEKNYHTLGFNFRSVGKSEGEFAEGVGELSDLNQVLSWAQQHYPQLDLALSGFSFGAFVSISAAAQWPLKCLVSIAPPVGRFYFDLVKLPTCPWLVVQPMEDDVLDAPAVVDWYRALNLTQSKLIEFPNAGHFFHSRLIELKQTIKDGLEALGV